MSEKSDLGILVDDNGREWTYEQIQTLMDEAHFPMELVGEDAAAVERAVNMGIDARLEACFRSGVDSYEWVRRRLGGKLACSVSPESLPVLLRRLFEDGDPSGIARDIIDCLSRDREE